MKTNLIKQFLFRAMAIVVACTTVFSCQKDYDGDIEDLNKKLAEVTTKVSDLQKQLNDLEYIKTAEIKDGKLVLTSSTGKTVTYATPFSVYNVEVKNGTEIYVDGKKVATIVPPEPKLEVKNGTEIWLNGVKVGTVEVKDPVLTLNADNEILVNGKPSGIKVPKDPVLTLSSKRELMVNGVGSGVIIPEPYTGPTVTLVKVGGKLTGVEVKDGSDVVFIPVGVDNLLNMVDKRTAHRLNSIAFLPEQNINGIPAIKFLSLAYEPQKFVKETEIGQESTTKAKEELTVGCSKTIVKYRLNPRVGVRAEDFKMPSFHCIVADNDYTYDEYMATKAVDEDLAGVDSPIAPVAGQKFNIDKDGVLQLEVKKTTTTNINREFVGEHAEVLQPTGTGLWWWMNVHKEKFYMASLNVPIADALYTEEEKAASAKPSVHSEYVRIGEVTVPPYIKSTKAGPATGFYAVAPYDKFPNEIDIKDKPLHYSDSLRLWKSDNKECIDEEVNYDKSLDLKTLVTVCQRETHETIKNYRDYGLALRFHIAGTDKSGKITTPYHQGINLTDEQEFALLDSDINGILTSKVYTVGDITKSKTAIGREPIIRVTLYDTVNNWNIVCMRYIKIRWENKVPETHLDPYTFPSDVVSCEYVSKRFLTKEMNELVYHAVNGSMSKEEFHSVYKTLEIDKLTKDGSTIYTTGSTSLTASTDETVPADIMLYLMPDALSTTSYNLMWQLSPKAVGKVKTGGSTYTLTFRFQDPSGVYGDVIMDFIVKIGVPSQEFYYNGTFWDGGTHSATDPIFNINPINYKPKEDAADPTVDGIITSTIKGLKTTSPYSQIKTDLVNAYMFKGFYKDLAKKTGWVKGTDAKPVSLSEFIREIRKCAKVRFKFNKAEFGKYPHLAGYTTSNFDTELWKTIPGTFNNTEDPTRTDGEFKVKYQDDALAGWIDNMFGSTVATNIDPKYLPYDEYNEILGSGFDECRAIIQLAEKDYLNGTAAAKEIVGKKVPVVLSVAYNEYNDVVVDKFDVFFIDPLNIDAKLTGELKDNVYGGSFTDARKALAATDWVNYVVQASNAGSGEKQKYSEELYHFYAVKGVTFVTEKATTDLKWNAAGTSYDQDPSVTDGKLPDKVTLTQVDNSNPATCVEVTVNPGYLRYLNNSGTPVNKDYHIFMPVKVEHKWGTTMKEKVSITIRKNM